MIMSCAAALKACSAAAVTFCAGNDIKGHIHPDLVVERGAGQVVLTSARYMWSIQGSRQAASLMHDVLTSHTFPPTLSQQIFSNSEESGNHFHPTLGFLKLNPTPPIDSLGRLRSISSFMMRSASLIFFGCSTKLDLLVAKGFFFVAKTFLGLLVAVLNASLTAGGSEVIDFRGSSSEGGVRSPSTGSAFALSVDEL